MDYKKKRKLYLASVDALHTFNKLYTENPTNTDELKLQKKLRKMKEILEMDLGNRIFLEGEMIERCNCPMCGEKFDPRENMKSSYSILYSKL